MIPLRTKWLFKGGNIVLPQHITVEPQWLEHLWDHRKLFETWVVRATEGYLWHQFRKQIAIIQGNLFDYLRSDCMLSALIRIASMRQF